MLKYRYGMIFPELDENMKTRDEISLYSERKIEELNRSIINSCETMICFNDFFLDDIQSSGVELTSPLSKYIVERNKTRQMAKQIHHKKRALDALIENYGTQKAIELAEYSKRMNILLEERKRSLRLEYDKCLITAQQQLSDIEMKFEEVMKANEEFKMWITTNIQRQKEMASYLEELKSMSVNELYHTRKEFILMCESQNMVMQKLGKYLVEI